MFQEIGDNVPFAQGDVLAEFKARADNYNSSSDVFLVILTADCDIYNLKMGKHFTVIFVVTAEYYLKQIWAEVEISKILSNLLDESTANVNEILRVTRPDLGQFRAGTLLQLLVDKGPAALLSVPVISSAEQSSRLKDTCDQIVHLHGVLSSKEHILSRLLEMQTSSNQKI